MGKVGELWLLNSKPMVKLGCDEICRKCEESDSEFEEEESLDIEYDLLGLLEFEHFLIGYNQITVKVWNLTNESNFTTDDM